jgi:hypothetical protein
MTPEGRDERVEILARNACDQAWDWGDRPDDWASSDKHVRDSFRSGARATLAALEAAGYSVVKLEQIATAAQDEDGDWEFIEGAGTVKDTVGRADDGAWLYEPWGEPLYRKVTNP